MGLPTVAFLVEIARAVCWAHTRERLPIVQYSRGNTSYGPSKVDLGHKNFKQIPLSAKIAGKPSVASKAREEVEQLFGGLA